MCYYPEEYQINVSQLNKTLKLIGHFSKNEAMFNSRMTIKFRISVPDNFNIKFQQEGGSIYLKELEGYFTGYMLGGDIALNKLEGSADIDSDGSTIRVERGNLNGIIKNRGGHIGFREVKGNLKGIADGGSINYQNVFKEKYDGKVSLQSRGGNIEIDEAPYGATVRNRAGNITINSANEKVEVDTKGGNIVLKNIRGSIHASTYSGNIEADILPLVDKDKGQTIDLKSNSGDITLFVPKDYKSLIEIKLAYSKNKPKRYKIESDLDIEITESPGWDFSKGTARKYIYGKAQSRDDRNKLKIETTNGNIRLIKK